jgi:PAS domain S-box-containing protein
MRLFMIGPDKRIHTIHPYILPIIILCGVPLHASSYPAYNPAPDVAGILLSEILQTDTIPEEGAIVSPENPFLEDTLKHTKTVSEAENTETLAITVPAIADSAVVETASSRAAENFPFYRRWWFSLLIVLLAVPFLYRFLTIHDKARNKMIEEQEFRENEIKKELAEKKDQLIRQESEFNAKLIEEEELKYSAVGLSRFSEILSSSKEELKKLGQHLMHELVKYLGVNMGALYIVKGENGDDRVLELLSGYAPDQKQMEARIHPGEGYVGTCFKEGTVIEITDVPETYTKISSGLGEAIPRSLVFLPLMQDETRLGVIELASFKKLEKYKLDFVQKLTLNIASFIAIRTATARLQEMLEQSQSQAEELQAQEEELRQNLEEMQATQEELARQMEKNKRIQEDLAKEKSLMDALMNSLPEHIYFKDLNSKFLKTSKSLSASFRCSDPKDLLGKSDFDFFSDEHARPAFEGEQNIIKTGKPIIDLVEKEVKKDGSVSWVSTTKMPLVDHQGKIVGTFGISKDITDKKKMELEISERNRALLSQEEELRQSLEQMKTIQEDLHRRIEENEKNKIESQKREKELLKKIEELKKN